MRISIVVYSERYIVREWECFHFYRQCGEIGLNILQDEHYLYRQTSYQKQEAFEGKQKPFVISWSDQLSNPKRMCQLNSNETTLFNKLETCLRKNLTTQILSSSSEGLWSKGSVIFISDRVCDHVHNNNKILIE